MTGTGRSSIKEYGLNLMSAKFRNIRDQTDLRKQGCDFSPQPAHRGILFPGGIAQGISYFFLHALSMPFGKLVQKWREARRRAAV